MKKHCTLPAHTPFHPLLLALLGAYTLIVSHGVGRFLYTASLPTLLAQTQLTTVVSGYIASANYAGYLVGAIMAMLVSRRHTLHSMQLGIVLSIITSFLIIIQSISLWYVARFFSGLGSALILVNGSTLLLSQFPEHKRTFYAAIYYAGVGMGVMFSSVVVYSIRITTIDYSHMWLLGGLISLPALVIAWHLRTLTLTKPSTQAHHLSVHASKDRRFIIASYALGGFGYITAATFLPVIVLDNLATGAQQLAHMDMLIWAVVGVAAAVSNPLWGKLAQQYDEITMLLASIVTQILSLLIPVYVASLPLLVVAALLFGGSFMAIVSLSMGAVKHLSAKRINFFLGLATVCYSVGQIVGPLVSVYLYEKTQSFDAGLLVAVAVYVVSAGCLLPVVSRRVAG